jgi:two-component system response regulator RegA
MRFQCQPGSRSLSGTDAAGGVASRKILILDDEPAIAALFAAVLKGAGHEVVVCTGFEEARAYVKQAVPEGLLTDVRVGEFNGLHLAIFFRSVSPTGALMVVSGHDDVVIRNEAAQIGAGFMVKPVDMAALTRFFASAEPASNP